MNIPTNYRIRIKGHLDETWNDWFEGLTITNLENGEAELVGALPDQAALQGVLTQISSLGLVLISVNSVQEDNDLSAADQEAET
jgi:hypothetical protein